MRLQKYISNCGWTSRRRAALLIQAGRVQVNGKVLTSLGTTIDLKHDKILVNGEEISPPPRRTILFSKPAGIITSTHDTHDRLTVMDLLPRSLQVMGVVPAGRLDQDTEGLLVLTNDGDLAHRITHPSFETEKEYDVLVVGAPSRGSIQRLEGGIQIAGEMTSPARIKTIAAEGNRTRLSVVLREGKKRQVRRMFESIGNEVIHLRRVRIGGLHLGDLPSGEWRDLSPEEILSLTGGKVPRPRKKAR